MLMKMMKDRGPRVLTALLALSLALTLGACSSMHKAKVLPKTGDNSLVTPSLNEPTAPVTPEPRRMEVTTTEEFPPSAGVADVRFDYDKADLRPDQLAVLDKNIAYFKGHPDVKIMIEGHADERGTIEYNLALGQRRAAAVQDYLLKSGLAADRLATISKGKENPADTGHNEAAWAKNRRAHFMRMF